MSIKYMNEAWLMPLNSHEKIVLLAISDWANDDGVAYPSYDALMKKTGMAKATLAKHLKILRELGVIKSENHSEFGKGKKVNLYTISSRSELPYSSDSELIVKIKELRKNNASPKSSTLEPAKVQNVDPKSSTLEHEPSVLTTSKDTSVSRTKKKFIKPTLQEVIDYCNQRQNKVRPERFHAYYEANGWKTGKNPMRDWEAAIRYWESQSGGSNGTHQQNDKQSDYLDELNQASI